MGRARDLLTPHSGAAVVVGVAELEVVVDYRGTREIQEIRSAPHDPALAELVGVRVTSGFRARLGEVLPREAAERSLLFGLLDDLPGAALVSSSAYSQAGLPRPMAGASWPVGACSGWRPGGTMMMGVERDGAPPPVTGPVAPAIDDAEDPLAWHETGSLGPHGMRRSRLVDVVESSPVVVDVAFRDLHRTPLGVATVIHEYAMRAHIDPEELRALEILVEPRVLPWLECQAAIDGVRKVEGSRLEGFGAHVRRELGAPSSCTHLDDMLRKLEDVPVLLRELRALTG